MGPLGFDRRRESWGGCGVPGERSLSLGTPGLHDASPLGLGGKIALAIESLLKIAEQLI